jgi:transcription antitermination factor NusG
MSYWACAQLLPSKAALALHCLAAAGYAVYYPRLREQRRSYGRKIEVRPPLFLNYAFVRIELQWHTARWAPGVCRLVTNGDGRPAIVAEAIISEIRARERNGLVELPKPQLEPGAKVRIVEGPLAGLQGLVAGMKPRARVEVLLALLGGQQRVALARDAVEAV